MALDAFAEAVRTRRRHLGLRQAELADLAGVSERLVYALGNGKVSVQLDKVTGLWLTDLNGLPYDRGTLHKLQRVIAHRRRRLVDHQGRA